MRYRRTDRAQLQLPDRGWRIAARKISGADGRCGEIENCVCAQVCMPRVRASLLIHIHPTIRLL